MNIDFSKAPTGTVGAMIADFDNPNGRGYIEFLPGSGPRGKYREGKGQWIYHEAPHGQTWNGEGLPPVGTLCERYYGDKKWEKTTICGHSPDGKSWAAYYDDERAGWGDCSIFRPIRTPQQIAAEEREIEIVEIERIAISAENSGKTWASAIYDAGYRKQVKP